MNFQLVRPHIQYKDSFLQGLRAFQQEGLPWHVALNYDQIARNFPTYVEEQLKKVTLRTANLVPETELWGIVDGQYAGRISIRHELTEALRKVGGHIGYDTVPSYRKRGVATLMLQEALPIAQSLGLKKVLITCDDNNTASIRVIEKNGGVMKKKQVVDPARPPKRYYWIEL